MRPRPLSSVAANGAEAKASGIGELDRVLGGGIVPGSVTVIGGEPGIGKSTLVLQAAAAISRAGERSLVVAAEESAEQVRSRSERLGPPPEECFVLPTVDLARAIEASDCLSPSLLVVDSIQAVSDASCSAPAGSPSQVRESAQLLVQHAKATGTATVIVGHVTKDGSLAGPRTLEHLVDTVLAFEGDRHHALRSLVAVKHRFGPAGEIGMFEMGEEGLVSLDDPSAVLLSDRRPGTPGTAVLAVAEGHRPLLVEVQALTCPSTSASPRRVAEGLSSSRLALILAVLERSCSISLSSFDVFVSTVGGIKVTEPAADLAIALALASSSVAMALPPDVVSFGEVGLGGELRQVPRAERRVAEASRLGFSRALAPSGSPGSGVVGLADLESALVSAGLPVAPAPRRRCLEAVCDRSA